MGTGDVPGYWDTGLVDMPNLEQFVNDGVVFTDAHSTPLCSPSRYVLLSGNYQHRGYLYTGTWQLNYRSSQFLNHQQSIADVLKANGYHTAMMGKWHIGGWLKIHERFPTILFGKFASDQNITPIFSSIQEKFRQSLGLILEITFT